MQDDLSRVLVDEAAIARRVRELAEEIDAELEAGGRQPDLVLVPVMTGAMIFVADLVRQLPRYLRMRMTTASSYPGKATESTGDVRVGDLPADVAGRDVLLVDDILDSGRTLTALREAFQALGPRTLRTCVLLRKDTDVARSVPCDHVGFDIPDEFVVGYGLDYDGLYRNLPEIGVLREDRR